MLQQQENSFKCFVQILVDSTNKIMDDLTREVQDLKNILQFSHGQLNELMTAICKSLREDISSRQNNMVVDRIAESPHETWTESEDKVRERISEKLKMDHRKIEVDRANRTGKPTTGPGDRPRPIVVKFLRLKAR